MKISSIIALIKSKIPYSWLLLHEMWCYWRRLLKYNAMFNTDNDIQKMQYTLLRENHVIEKGMSMSNPRKGFGQGKVSALIKRLRKYNNHYGNYDKSFLIYPLSTIKAYITYQQQDNVDIQNIENDFHELCKEAGINAEELKLTAGINIISSESLQRDAKSDFVSLLNSRHSIRYFKDELPEKEKLEKALEMASRTPSACNRQAWHTHFYFGTTCHQLLKMQGGCNGFEENIHCCIVVTADMKGFLDYEPFQCYIDGGLYAMNLINALHYEGLGTIPLSCGFYHTKLKEIHKTFDIPENETLIVIIGCGNLTDEIKIAVSSRKPYNKTNTYHDGH